MGKSLYRSYRSRSFDEIIGQDHITTVLKNSLKNESVGHAYLLSGPRGVGKTSTARILAHAVNEINYEGENINLDIIEIDAASNRRIDEVREIRERVHIAPVAGKYKVYIIDEVHMLTKEAFNALLKTLEEPPAHAIFILATTESHKIPDTILSRCIRLNFKPINNDLLTSHLKNIAKSEKINISDSALAILAEHSNGSFRDGISLLEQVKYVADKIDDSQVNMMLGLSSTKTIDYIVTALESGDIINLRKTLDDAYSSGANESVLASQISAKLREALTSEGRLNQDKLLQVLHELLYVAGSSNSRIELELALTTLALSSKRTVARKDVHPVATEVSKKEIKKDRMDNSETPVYEIADVQIEKTDKNDGLWQEFLNELKTVNNTLYGIARMAEVSEEEQKIDLKFKFAFHYKQINEPKNLQIFNELLHKLTKDPPKIVVSKLESENKPKNDSLKNLSNIFGGHEVLES